MNINNIFLIFTIYSFLGWCTEVVYQYWAQKKFINRGFLNGPFCPIYGACALLIIFLLQYFSDIIQVNLITLFIISTTLISFIEYITSYILEKLFDSKWWDYTDDPLNLNGRICLPFSLAWGLGTILGFKVINPIILYLVNLIPLHTCMLLTILILLYFTADSIFTLTKLIFKNDNTSTDISEKL